jgi:hypothetical protein
MTCSNCGLPEGLGECEDCCELAHEICINREILATVKDETLPTDRPLAHREHMPGWWLAVAAASVLAMAVSTSRFISPAPAPAPSVHNQFGTPQPPLVKMLTPNPDVVIYWIVDSKEKTSR